MMKIDQRATKALASWMASPARAQWPELPNRIMLTTWHGEEIAMPGLDEECFEIIRVSDSSVLDEDQLDCQTAVMLPWEVIDLEFIPVKLI
jgi:hypothetical protein